MGKINALFRKVDLSGPLPVGHCSRSLAGITRRRPLPAAAAALKQRAVAQALYQHFRAVTFVDSPPPDPRCAT